jgi:hypothetical protein
MHARLNHADWCPDVWIWIVILALWINASRREYTSFGRLQRSSRNYALERNPEACRTLRVVRTCCWNVRMDACWSSSKLLDTGERPDGWCFGQMDVQKVWHVVQTADRELNFLTCKLCRIFWKHFWIVESLLKSIFTKKWFFPTEFGHLQTNTSQRNQIPCIRPDNVIYCPDADLSKHHPSGRRQLSVRTLINV